VACTLLEEEEEEDIVAVSFIGGENHRPAANH
jgi:hypothetical protein